MARQLGYFCSLRAALHIFPVRLSQVASLPSLLTENDVELYGSTLAHARLDRVVTDDRNLVNEDVIVGILAIDETVSALDVKTISRCRALVDLWHCPGSQSHP